MTTVLLGIANGLMDGGWAGGLADWRVINDGSMSTAVRDGQGTIVGVLQAINKRGGFGADDTRR